MVFLMRKAKMSFSCAAVRHILITDPCLVKNQSEFKSHILEPNVSTPNNIFIKVPVTLDFMQNLKNKKNFQVYCKETSEIYYALGRSSTLNDYKYLGMHGSDSGLSCVLDFNAYEQPELVGCESSEDLEFDWEEFVLSTLEDPQTQTSPDDYPLLRFYGRIPQEDWRMAVYGLPNPSDVGTFDGIALRAASDSIDIGRRDK